MWTEMLEQLKQGSRKWLARAISLVENDYSGSDVLLQQLRSTEKAVVIGITGPPGAGKSTLTDSLIENLLTDGKQVAVLCVDPSSPFHMGALLGDRIRMSKWYTNERVFIRSLASRGALGGLHPRIMEITDLLKAAGFDYVIVETVGVGQSEVEIAGLADITVVVLVPEAGDDVQAMKAGLMEIADIFVVNKGDRPGADEFVKNLRQMSAPAFHHGLKPPPIVKTIASSGEGVDELAALIKEGAAKTGDSERKLLLLTEKAWLLISRKKMENLSRERLKEKLAKIANADDFNLYRFVEEQASTN